MIDEGPQRLWHKPAFGVIEKWPGEALPPLRENWHQGARLQMRPDPILEDCENSAACDCRFDGEIGCASGLDDERGGRIDEDGLAVALKLPWRERSTGKPDADAAMLQKVARFARRAPAFEIGP